MTEDKTNLGIPKRDKLIHIAVTEDEKKKYKIHAKQMCINMSEMIREAVRDYVCPKKPINPVFNPPNNLNLKEIEAIFRKVLNTSNEIQEKFNLMEEKLKLIPKLLNLMEEIFYMDLSRETEIVVELFQKSNKSLSAKDIIETTQIDKVKVLRILTGKENNLFKLDFSTGRWRLR